MLVMIHKNSGNVEEMRQKAYMLQQLSGPLPLALWLAAERESFLAQPVYEDVLLLKAEKALTRMVEAFFLVIESAKTCDNRLENLYLSRFSNTSHKYLSVGNWP
jgi:hypothetical protein